MLTLIRSQIIAGNAFTFVFAAMLLIAACTSPNEIPANEIRHEKLNKVIMCPICPGESIDQATNDLALQMRGIVREQIDDGWTDDQIKQFWIERYGPSVILEPPRQGFSLVAWLLPPLGVASAGLGLFWALKWMRRSPTTRQRSVAESVNLSEKELSYYTQRIESILDSEGAGPVRNEHGEVSRSHTEGAS